ncbi:NACHT domain-containing protein [Clostridium estertheticum]|uniref:NACHT domain-containing protein n=1 Tax=Clostridium estertheticum TaxID=238834 RepID=UPI001C0BEF2E|nr:NACHT domain-containing protein [Clostridium estertheticum]MBU3177649.1 NACHT domain-containing protein [Clostridium estertheticum]
MFIEGLVQGVIANYIFEWSKAYNIKSKKDDIVKQLDGFQHEFENTVLDCGTFNSFLHLIEIKADFQNFIQYGIFKDVLNEERLTKGEFISIISKKAFTYIKDNRSSTLVKIQQFELDNYFKVIINLFEKNIIKHMSKDIGYNDYLLRVRIDELFEKIIKTKDFRPCLEQNDLEYIKNQYIKMMSEKYKMVHIYGIEELGFNSFYIRPSFTLSVKENELNPISINPNFDEKNICIIWKDIFSYSNIVSIIGGAGFGKTLFLKNMINEYKDLDVLDAKQMLPIYCDLKKFSEKINKSMSYTIKDFLVDSMKYDTSLNEISQKFLDYYLEKGQCLILFDALDEVNSSERFNVHNLIVTFFENTNKNNKICITSRERGFIPKTKIIYRVKTVDIIAVEKYVDKLILIHRFNSGFKGEFIRECKKLIEIKFLESFLMLSLLVNLYKAERRMPKNKIELYKKSVEYISKEREMGISGECIRKADINFDLIGIILDTDESFEKLAYLAKPNNKEVTEEDIKKEFFALHNVNYSSKNETLLATKEFLKFCAERTELFVMCNEKEYKFYHKSFFEYFYSKYIIHHMNFEELFLEILSFDFSQEIPAIAIGLLKDSKFSEYKQFIDFVFTKINDDKIDLFDTLNILSNIDEPGYLVKIYDCFFNDKKLLCKSLFQPKSKSQFALDMDGITNFIQLNVIFDNIFRSDKVQNDKNLCKDISTYYKEEYLKTMYIRYVSAISLDVYDVSKSERDQFKYSMGLDKQLTGLNIVHTHLSNIFSKKDFKKVEINNILKTVDIIFNHKVLTLKEKRLIINDFYSDIYIQSNDNVEKYIAATK